MKTRRISILKFRNLKQILSLFALLANLIFAQSLLTACSSSGSSSNIQIQLPDWSARRSADLKTRSLNSSLAVSSTSVSIIAINVTGSGITTPQTFYWQRSSDSDSPPTTASFTIPRGSQRLFQVMAVYSDVMTEFYYGETKQDILSDTAVDITLASVGAANGGVQGKVMGRYLRADLTGPTGVYQYRFVPPSGSPSMIVTTGEVFGGWVSLFALDTSLIQYTRVDGSSIFPLQDANGADTQLNNASALFFSSANAPGIVRVEIPAGYYDEGVDSSDTQASAAAVSATPSPTTQPSTTGSGKQGAQSAQRLVMGFFGPGSLLQSHKFCYNPVAGAAVANLFMTSSETAAVNWAGPASGNTTAEVAYLPPVALLNSGTSVTPGTPYSGCQDAADVQYVNALSLDETKLAQGENAIGIQPPFQIMENGNPLTTSYDPGLQTLTVSWNLLPGVAQDLGHVGVFYRQNPFGTASDDSDIRNAGDGYNCNGLTTLPQPFTEIQVGASATSTTISNLSAALAGQLEVVVCPYDSTRSTYFNSGAMTTTNSSSQIPSLVFEELVDPTNQTVASGSNCIPFRIALRDQNSTLVSTPAAIAGTFSYTGAAGGFGFYDSSSCSNPSSNSFAIPAGSTFSSGMTIWARMPSGGGYTIQVTTQFDGGFAAFGRTTPVYLVDPAAPASLVGFSSSPAFVDRCTSGIITLNGSSGAVQSLTNATTIGLASTASVFYSDPSCRSLPITSAIVPAGQAAKKIYFISHRAISDQFQLTGTTGGLTSLNATVQVGTANLTQYGITINSGTNYPYSSGTCASISVATEDEQGYQVQLSTSHAFQITAASGAFYNDSSCTTSLLGSSYAMPFSAYGPQSSTIYLLIPPYTSSVTISGQDSATAAIIGNSITISKAP